MVKQIGVTLLLSLLVLSAGGCTSKNVESEDGDPVEGSLDGDAGGGSGGDDAALADDAGGNGGDAAKADAGGDGLTNDDDVIADLGSDSSGDKDLQLDDPPKNDGAAPGQDEFADMDMDAAAPADAPPADQKADAPPADQNPSDQVADMAAKPEDAPPATPDSAPAPAPVAAAEEPPPAAAVAPPSDSKPKASLKKVADAPFERNGVLLNAVYLARSGDTIKSVSTKIYGSTAKAKEIAKANPSLHKNLKVGDKVYYNSPQRPTDNTKMLTLYEDLGMEPEIYVAKSGDNLKPVSKQLLGHKDSWKEVWSTNPAVDSKGELSEGTQIRYWASSDVSAPPQAAKGAPADAPPVDDLAANAPPVPDQAAVAPPPPMMPPAGTPPPGPSGAAAAGVIEPPPPPPPPTMPEPPPPPPASKMAKNVAPAEDPMDTVYMGGGAALVLAAVAMYIMIRKKRSRRQLDFNTGTQTQIE